MEDDYIPFGHEWCAEMKKFTKADLIGLLRKALIEKNRISDMLPSIELKEDHSDLRAGTHTVEFIDIGTNHAKKDSDGN